MHSAASEKETSSWLVSDGLNELELLLRAVLSHQSDPILIADDDRCCVDASSGACKLLGVSMSKMIGQPIDDLVEPGKHRYTAMNNVLPGRHVLLLDNKSEFGFRTLVPGCRAAWLLPGTRERSAFTATRARKSSVDMPAASMWMTRNFASISRTNCKRPLPGVISGMSDGIRKRMARASGRIH